MCMAAIYWAGIKTVWYGAGREDADRIGFGDNFIYEELKLPPERRTVAMHRLEVSRAKELFDTWENKQDKVLY